MSDEQYTNLDLDTAEEMLIVAGKPELAKALRFQAQGVRNLVQGEWGMSFVNALENIMDTRVVSVLASVQQRLDQQIGIAEQILNTAKDAQNTAREALTVAKDGRARLKKFHEELEGLRKGQTDYNVRLDAVIERLDKDEARLDSKRQRIELLETEVRELRGPDMSPEQRQHAVDTLLKMIAWWDRTHPEGVD